MKKVEKAQEKFTVGVIVGRFHVDVLHEAHIDLIQSVCNEHEKVIIFLGLSHLKGTINNPLDFESRKQMILEKFPQTIVIYIKDNREDEVWSKDLDEKIRDLISPTQTVMLYGSRDSFISHYSGIFPTQELMQEVYVSGSEIRKNISKTVKSSADFRKGVIWLSQNQYPKVVPTVDIAIFNEDYTKMLMARKPNEKLYRFVGGYADPSNESFEQDARREAMEETQLEVGDLKYVCSIKILDWRYKNEKDSIRTTFFTSKLIFGRPTPSDDLAGGDLRWFDLDKILPTDLVVEHRPLLVELNKYLKK